MSHKIAAIDFETANEQRSSVCSVGVAIVANDGIQVLHYYVRPPEMRFNPQNVAVHGITPEKVANAPTFDLIFPKIFPEIRNAQLWAHNAAFEKSVIRSLSERYNLPNVEPVECTMKLSKRMLPGLDDYKLGTVCRQLGINLAQHHDAGLDAKACLQIVTTLEKIQQSGSVDPIKNPYVRDDESMPVHGRTFVLLGKLEDKDFITQVTRRYGGIIQEKPSRTTNYVVVGQRPSKNTFAIAERLLENGSGVRFVTESRWAKAIKDHRASNGKTVVSFSSAGDVTKAMKPTTPTSKPAVVSPAPPSPAGDASKTMKPTTPTPKQTVVSPAPSPAGDVSKKEEPSTKASSHKSLKCPLCSKLMAVRIGRNGDFYGCSGFPKCRMTLPVPDPTDPTCPECGYHMVKRQSRTGSSFYGCSTYPKCHMTLTIEQAAQQKVEPEVVEEPKKKTTGKRPKTKTKSRK